MYQLTGSALELGMVTAARGLPLLVFGIIAGAVADRSGRKLQLIVAQLTNAAVNLALATLVLTHHVQPWHVYATALLAGTVQAFQQPARQTLVSDIVGNKHLLNALALNSAALNGARAIGPAIGGILIAAVGVDGSYYAQAALYLMATVWTFQMAVPGRSPESAEARREPFVTSVKNGLVYVGRNRTIRTLLIIALGPMFLTMPYTSMMPIFALDVLHGGARLQGLLLTCVGIGALAGALYVASVVRRSGYTWVVVAGAIAFSAGVLGFSLSRWVPISVPLLLATGVFSVTYQTQDQTLAQILAPRHLRGRVMSIYLLNRGLVPMGSLLAGVLASLMGAPDALVLMSAAGMVLVAAVSLLTPGFLRVRVEFTDETSTGPPEPRLT
jgi:MFS family permease